VGDTNELILAWFSLRNARWEERCAAAAAGGFHGVGLNAGAFRRLDPGRDDAWFTRVAEDHGVQILEVEVARLADVRWSIEQLDLAAFVGARHVQTIAPFERRMAVEEGAAAIAALCAAATARGLRLAFEFLPPTDVPDAPTAVRWWKAAGSPDGFGLCVDSWHVFRGGGLPSLEELDPALVTAIQFDDGPMRPTLDDYIQDCLHYRCAPGDGEFDLDGFLARLPYRAPVSVEVIDDDLDALPPLEVGRVLGEATRRVLDRRVPA